MPPITPQQRQVNATLKGFSLDPNGGGILRDYTVVIPLEQLQGELAMKQELLANGNTTIVQIQADIDSLNAQIALIPVPTPPVQQGP